MHGGGVHINNICHIASIRVAMLRSKDVLYHDALDVLVAYSCQENFAVCASVAP